MTQETGIRRELEAVRKTAGASLRSAVDWHSINWKETNHNVRRLQSRIAQAQRQGQNRKVRALQFILTRSFSARCLAVRRATENTGKRTPGVDGQLFSTPAQKARAVERLTTEDYQAQPLKRVLIPKNSGEKARPLGIPMVRSYCASVQWVLGFQFNALGQIGESILSVILFSPRNILRIPGNPRSAWAFPNSLE
jgi:RNA-directed DNA polymerase